MKLEDKIKTFQHIYNPQHLYCRLRELNISVPEARKIMQCYDEEVYREINSLIKLYSVTHINI